ncbi:uncharacterized protein [Dysidea avara]|uniref:uncharacterized protein n=1 Tax=Dysidea avara TaxID=196820 RepID=UPI00332A65D0
MASLRIGVYTSTCIHVTLLRCYTSIYTTATVEDTTTITTATSGSNVLPASVSTATVEDRTTITTATSGSNVLPVSVSTATVEDRTTITTGSDSEENSNPPITEINLPKKRRKQMPKRKRRKTEKQGLLSHLNDLITPMENTLSICCEAPHCQKPLTATLLTCGVCSKQIHSTCDPKTINANKKTLKIINFYCSFH